MHTLSKYCRTKELNSLAMSSTERTGILVIDYLNLVLKDFKFISILWNKKSFQEGNYNVRVFFSL